MKNIPFQIIKYALLAVVFYSFFACAVGFTKYGIQ